MSLPVAPRTAAQKEWAQAGDANGAGSANRFTWAVLLIVARLLATAACAVAAAIATSRILDRALPSATSFDQTFERLGWALWIGVAAGVALGGVLTHPLGRGRFSCAERVGLGAISAVSFLIIGGLAAFG